MYYGVQNNFLGNNNVVNYIDLCKDIKFDFTLMVLRGSNWPCLCLTSLFLKLNPLSLSWLREYKRGIFILLKHCYIVQTGTPFLNFASYGQFDPPPSPNNSWLNSGIHLRYRCLSARLVAYCRTQIFAFLLVKSWVKQAGFKLAINGQSYHSWSGSSSDIYQ